MFKLFSRLFFWESTSMLKCYWKKKSLSFDDLLKLPEDFQSEKCHDTLKNVENSSDSKYFIFKILQSHSKTLLTAFILNVVATLAVLAHPEMTHLIISSIGKELSTQNIIFLSVLSLLFAFSFIVSGVSMQHQFQLELKLRTQITSGLNLLIQRKSQRLSRWTRNKKEIGDMVNYITNDTRSMAFLPMVFGSFLRSFVFIFCGFILLFRYIGIASLVPIFLTCILIPTIRYIGKHFTSIDEKIMQIRDKRLSVMSQLLNGIRIVKFFAWRKSMNEEVQKVRREEIKSLKKMVLLESVSIVFFYFTTAILTFSSLITFVLMGNELNPGIIFSVLVLFKIIEDPLGDITFLMADFFQAKVSGGRILEFLKLEEKPQSESSLENENVLFEAQEASWQHELNSVECLNLKNFSLRKGESVAIVGPVGSGKSSFLLGMLQELHQTKGYSSLNILPSQLAFVPQEAFVLSGSFRENILLERKEGDLEKALFVSCLEQDLKDMKASIDTQIGENGITLSGGQKQRLQIARASFAPVKLALLDDPLSALDPRTEHQIVERLIFGLWKDITRVVVTHRLSHLNLFDRVLFVQNGDIKAEGTLSELLEKSPEFVAFYKEHEGVVGHDQEITPSQSLEFQAELQEDESHQKGAVHFTHYLKYVRAMGEHAGCLRYVWLFLMFVLTILVAFGPLIQNGWMASWSNYTTKHLEGGSSIYIFSEGIDSFLKGMGGDTLLLHVSEIFKNDFSTLLVFGFLGIVLVLIVYFNRVVWGFSGVMAASYYHNKALDSVLKAKLRFFDTNPSGRVLNRFSTDLGSMEKYIPWAFSGVVRTLLKVLVSLMVMIAVFPLISIVAAVMLLMVYFLQKYYRAVSRDLQRFESIKRSPYITRFKEAVVGYVSLRAMGRNADFAKKFEEQLDAWAKSFYSFYINNRWFMCSISLLTSSIILALLLGVGISSASGTLTVGAAGLVLYYSLEFWQDLAWSVRALSELEFSMVSVERMEEYCILESEKDILVEPALPDWKISSGYLEFKDVVARYDEHLPDILKGVSFIIQAGSRVGIKGRTGSGKSTIFQTLFRFIMTREGEILIDGQNIAQIPLEVLRSQIAIIPQDPILFVGSLRQNLDRHGIYSDEDIWESLEKVYMKDYVESLEGKLLAPISENGGNLSLGQRQLLCLARAILLKTKIILLDEATASVDVQTDALIQKTIRTAFKNVTLIIIAHRLGTISDCDQIIELEQGVVKQIWSPLSNMD